MATKQNTELKELKQFIGDRFDELKMDIVSVKDEVSQLNTKVIDLDKKLAVIETKVDSTEKRLGTVEGKLPDISEKFGELKNWRQIAFIIIAAVVGWFARSTKF
jgi:chromosome segregation ATPase